MTGPLVVVGDALLDVDIDGDAARLSPDAPVPVVDVGTRRERAGGAGLAATLAAQDGTAVRLVCPVGDDAAGATLRELLSARLDVVPLPMAGTTVTKTRVRAGGQTLVRLDDGNGRAGQSPLSAAARAEIAGAGAILVSDYGRGTSAHPAVRKLLAAAATRGVPVVWDPHPRGAAPVARTQLVTPNRAETRLFVGDGEPATSAAELAERWQVDAVAVTLGADGAVLWSRGAARQIAARRCPLEADTCGAGDRFAGTAATAMLAGADVETAVREAVEAATRFVAGPTRPQTLADPYAFADEVRAGGGRLVATGGCFDLLHPGHVSLLSRARALGDALVVCINSDESVRRAKGRGRPIVAAADRARVLRELAAVDAVVVFAEPTPTEVIDRLRPDIWVKGSDWAGAGTIALPESVAVHRHGGEIVFVPVESGYSTTRLIHAAQASA